MLSRTLYTSSHDRAAGVIIPSQELYCTCPTLGRKETNGTNHLLQSCIKSSTHGFQSAYSQIMILSMPTCTPIWTREGAQAQARKFLFILEEQQRNVLCFLTSMAWDWHEYDPRRNSTKMVPPQASDDKEEDCLPALPRNIWGYGSVKLATPIAWMTVFEGW